VELALRLADHGYILESGHPERAGGRAAPVGGGQAVGSLIGITGIAALARLDGPDELLLLAVYGISGVGFGMRIALLAAIPADIFAGRHFGAILGAAHGGGGVGGFIGPFLAGWLFDITGNYQLAFAVAAASIAAAAVAAWVAVVRGRLTRPLATTHDG